MSFELDILDWIGSGSDKSPVSNTVASLKISVNGNLVTTVKDDEARTYRDHINVSAYALAEWLLINWWRLRWEPEHKSKSYEWKMAHSMPAIGYGYVWPTLMIFSDGEYVQFVQTQETLRDKSSIRFTNEFHEEIPVKEFEAEVDRFFNTVIDRTSSLGCSVEEFIDAREELSSERRTPDLMESYSIQARAGFYPGEVPTSWQYAIDELGRIWGATAKGEMAAILPDIQCDIVDVHERIKAIESSDNSVNLSWFENLKPSAGESEIPWKMGARLASEVRHALGCHSGPITDKTLNELFEIKLPLKDMRKTPIAGGVRQTEGSNLFNFVNTSGYIENQRFNLARFAASSLLSGKNNSYLPVTDAATALQKAERSFAQELLCPWSELDEFTDANGIDAEGVADAAKHFQVSQFTVLTTLANKGKLKRERLPGQLQYT